AAPAGLGPDGGEEISPPTSTAAVIIGQDAADRARGRLSHFNMKRCNRSVSDIPRRSRCAGHRGHNARPSLDDDVQVRIARVPSAWGHEMPSPPPFSGPNR